MGNDEAARLIELEEQVALYKPYYDAVDEALVCAWIGVAKGEPYTEIKQLELQAALLALDPCVSEDANNMVNGYCYYVNKLGFIYYGKKEQDSLVVEKQYYPLTFQELPASGRIYLDFVTGPYYNLANAKKEGER